MNIPRVVLDTNVIVSALLSPLGNPAKIYRMFLTEMLVLIYCSDILEEYRDVLCRPQLRIPLEEVKVVFSVIEHYGERVEPLISTKVMIDESDRVFYDVAKTARAYLITGNMRHYPRETFILTPKEFLEM